MYWAPNADGGHSLYPLILWVNEVRRQIYSYLPKCKQCGKVLQHKANINIHMMTYQTPQMQTMDTPSIRSYFEWMRCGTYTLGPSYLPNCKQCGKGLWWNGNLEKHMQAQLPSVPRAPYSSIYTVQLVYYILTGHNEPLAKHGATLAVCVEMTFQHKCVSSSNNMFVPRNNKAGSSIWQAGQ